MQTLSDCGLVEIQIMLLRMNWLPTEMNKYIVISSVIPVIPQSCRVCSNLKFVQIPGVLHFCSNSWNSLGFVFFECFCQVIARSSIVGGTVAMFRASWKLSAAVFCLRIYGQITTLHNITSAEKRREKGVRQTLSFFWFCFFFPCSLSNFLEGLAVAGHWSSSGSQSQQPSGIDFHFQEMSWMWCSMKRKKRNNENKYSNSTRGLALWAATLNNPIGAYVKFLADRGIVGSEFSRGLPVLRVQTLCCSQTRDEWKRAQKDTTLQQSVRWKCCTTLWQNANWLN